METREVLIKLGMALYIHRERIKEAQRGKAAVRYLQEKGALGGERAEKR